MNAHEEADLVFGEGEAPPDDQQGEPYEKEEVTEETRQSECPNPES